MLSRLGDTVLASLPYGAITQDSATREVSAVFFNYPGDMGRQGVGSELTYAATRALADRGPARRVRHTVAGLTPGTVFAVEQIDWDHGNVAEAWHRMGEPLNLTPAQTAELRESADALRLTALTVSGEGVLDIDLELPPWAVLSIAPARG